MSDRIIVTTCALAFMFVLGMDVQKWWMYHTLRTECIAQVGETLITSIQDETGIQCVYVANGFDYGKAKKIRRAKTKAATEQRHSQDLSTSEKEVKAGGVTPQTKHD
jgi:hypothetical protein